MIGLGRSCDLPLSQSRPFAHRTLNQFHKSSNCLSKAKRQRPKRREPEKREHHLESHSINFMRASRPSYGINQGTKDKVDIDNETRVVTTRTASLIMLLLVEDVHQNCYGCPGDKYLQYTRREASKPWSQESSPMLTPFYKKLSYQLLNCILVVFSNSNLTGALD